MENTTRQGRRNRYAALRDRKEKNRRERDFRDTVKRPSKLIIGIPERGGRKGKGNI